VGECARSPSLSRANEAKDGSTPLKPWRGCCPFPRHPSSPCGPHQDAGTSAARAKMRRSGSTWIIAHRMKAYRSMDERFTSGPSLGPRQRRGLAQCRAPPRGRTLRRPLLAYGRVRSSPQSRTKAEPDGETGVDRRHHRLIRGTPPQGNGECVAGALITTSCTTGAEARLVNRPRQRLLLATEADAPTGL
jgi:hypothetical protein